MEQLDKSKFIFRKKNNHGWKGTQGSSLWLAVPPPSSSVYSLLPLRHEEPRAEEFFGAVTQLVGAKSPNSPSL